MFRNSVFLCAVLDWRTSHGEAKIEDVCVYRGYRLVVEYNFSAGTQISLKVVSTG